MRSWMGAVLVFVLLFVGATRYVAWTPEGRACPTVARTSCHGEIGTTAKGKAGFVQCRCAERRNSMEGIGALDAPMPPAFALLLPPVPPPPAADAPLRVLTPVPPAPPGLRPPSA